MSTEQEVLNCIEYIQKSIQLIKAKICLLQCTSMYPISAGDAHLNVMGNFKKSTELTIGYSDHTEEPTLNMLLLWEQRFWNFILQFKGKESHLEITKFHYPNKKRAN